jgi:hypothetical protein
MKTTCALLLLLAAALPLRAQNGDPLKSPGCGAALATLQAARQSAADVKRVEALRRAASEACLGAAVVPTRPARIAQPPVVVPPPQIDAPEHAAPVPVPAMPQPPVAISRPATPATCDPGGCWTSDGTHLRHVPPNLAGPAGLCTQQGGLVYCP